jgi:nucleotide-binding universal stress UspA family protein
MRDLERTRVVVGYDGSSPARRALDWAADEAARRHVQLEVLHVMNPAGPAGAQPPGEPWPAPAYTRAETVTAEGVSLARRRRPDLRVSGTTLVGVPRTALVSAVERGDLLVVGTRGHGDLLGSVLGSVATAATVHAPCPVVVVRGDRVTAPGPAHPVVVGVDGSEPATAALLTAARVAARSGAPMRIVCAVRPAAVDAWTRAYWQAVNPGLDPVDAAVRAAEEVVARARALVRREFPSVTTHAVVAEGRPAAVLLAHGRDAALLVVGARGRGSVAGLFLGSVSHAVVHGADRPVLVVHAGAGTPAPALRT